MRASAVGVSAASSSGGWEAERRCSRSPCADRKRNSASSSVFIASPTRFSAREVGHAADGEFLQRVAAAREGDGAPRGAEALVEQPLHVAHLAQEHVLAAVG